jgi:hypothetical protein
MAGTPRFVAAIGPARTNPFRSATLVLLSPHPHASCRKAIIVTQPKKADLVTDRPIPALWDDYILVKVVSVGLNPLI